jgi:hypothetical protein
VANETSTTTLIFEVQVVDIDRFDGNNTKGIWPPTGKLPLLAKLEVGDDLGNALGLLKVG